MSELSENQSTCCSMEKNRLMEELRRCDFCTTGYEELHGCYRDAARESGRRGRTCLAP